jgi:hypothetical protein
MQHMSRHIAERPYEQSKVPVPGWSYVQNFLDTTAAQENPLTDTDES